MNKIIRDIIKVEIGKIFESFEFTSGDKNFTPTDPVSNVAGIALQTYALVKSKGWKVSSLDGKNNEGTGKTKAEELSQKTPQDFSKMKRLKAFFDKNKEQVDLDRQKFGITSLLHGTRQEMMKSETLLIWNLHGGDAGMNWVDKSISGEHDENMKTKERIRKVGGAGNNKGMGTMGDKHDPTNIRIHR